MSVDPVLAALAFVGAQAGLVVAFGRLLRGAVQRPGPMSTVTVTVRGRAVRRVFLPPDDPRVRPARRHAPGRRPVADRLPARPPRALA